VNEGDRVKTIKEATVGKAVLRLVDAGKAIVGIAIENSAIKLRVEGTDPDEVWMRLHNEIGKADPKYVGFDGARNRFLHFFPNGFHSAGYAHSERDYKIAAKSKLDQTAPLGEALAGSGFGGSRRLQGDQPPVTLREDAASGCASRPSRRPVRPRGGEFRNGVNERRIAGNGAYAEALRRG
jgi:hypothetical protein